MMSSKIARIMNDFHNSLAREEEVMRFREIMKK
jgi:hypothetical protein